MSSIWDDELRALQRTVWDRVADEIATWFEPTPAPRNGDHQ